jgi:PKD repeat protein
MHCSLVSPRPLLKATALLVGFAVASVSLFAAVTPSIVASRISGVAPLAVHFDASGTTSTATKTPFHDCLYQWDYGDPASGVWETSKKNKNRDVSPIAGHVFETPGKYTVTLIVTDVTGATAKKTVAITVTDPAVEFAGANTICISTDKDFTGAPPKALQITTSDWNEVTDQLDTGKRVLLKRGQTWNVGIASKNLKFPGPAIFGAFGTGPRPILRAVDDERGALFTLGHSTSPGQFSDFRVMDLEIDGGGYPRRFIAGEGTINDVTLLRIKMHDAASLLTLSPSTLDFHNNRDNPGHTLHSGISIVETEFNRLVGGQGYNIAFLGARKLLFLGNHWNDATGGEHVLRIPAAKRALLAHNRLTNAARAKHVVKLHAPNVDNATYLPPEERMSDHVVIADNYFYSELNNWLLTTGAQNTSSNERVRDVILERNTSVFGGPSVMIAFRIVADEHTIRNNVFILNENPTGGVAVEITADNKHIPAPANHRVYNNSVFHATSSPTLLRIGPEVSNTTVRNNLIKGGGSAQTILGSGINLQESHNLISSTPGWIVDAPTRAGDFALKPGSSAITAGTPVPVLEDFAGTRRAQTPKRGVGAFEYTPASAKR